MNQDEDDSMMAAVMLSSMSRLRFSPFPTATATAVSPSSSGSEGPSLWEKPEESDHVNSSNSGDALSSLVMAADIASNETSRKKRKASKGPKKEAATTGHRAKKARSMKTASSSSKQKTPSAAKPRGPKAMAAAAAALHQEDAKVAGFTSASSSKLEVKPPRPAPIRASGRTKQRIEELESQLESLGQHASKLEQENESLRKQMKDMVKKKDRKKPAAKRTIKGPAAPRSRKTTSSELKASTTITTLGTKPSCLPVETAKGKTKTDKNHVKTSLSGRGTKAKTNIQQGGLLLSIHNKPVFQDANNNQQATLKAPPPPPPVVVVTPPQTIQGSSSVISNNPQEDFSRLLAALLGGGEGLGTAAQKQRQEQDAQQDLQRQQQQQQQQQAQEFFASADNNFNRLLLKGFSNQANNNNNNNNNNVQQNKYGDGSSMGGGGTAQSNSPMSSTNLASKNHLSPPAQSQQEPSFAEFVHQHLASLQTQQAASGHAALLAPKELTTPQQDKHAVIVAPQQEQSDQGALLAWLLQQQLQQQSFGPTKPETTGFGHVTNGYMPNLQEQQSQQSPRTVSEVFTVPEQQQSFAATLSPRAEASPLFTSVASNSANTMNNNNDNNNVDATSQSFLNGQDFQSLQKYFSPEALLAILGAQQH